MNKSCLDELQAMVEMEAARRGINLGSPVSWIITAKRIEDKDPEMAYLLRASAKLWNSLEERDEK